MKKPEAEKALRHLIHEWASARHPGGISADVHPSFSEFKRWIEESGRSHYLSFRSVAGPVYDAEMWFDQELKQTWRR